MNQEWMEWTEFNLKRGSTPAEVRLVLKEHGFSEKDIKYALKKTLPKKAYQATKSTLAAQEKLQGRNPDADYAALANPRLVQNVDGEKIVDLSSDGLQLYTIPNFLSDELCDRLVETTREHAYPSKVSINDEQNAYRTSSTCDLSVQDHPYVAELEEAISQTLGFSLQWSEVNQAQMYLPGQEFKAHTDYFHVNTKDFARFASTTGQRTWTFMIYLNDTEAGGGTYFTKIDKLIMPEKGRAVCWNNLQRDGLVNPLSEHCGMPVEAGSKFIITKWFKDRGQGPALR